MRLCVASIVTLYSQSTEGSTVRKRPQAHKLTSDSASPPPPLPPKKIADLPSTRPPPRPPHDHDDDDVGPPLPKPAMRREPLVSKLENVGDPRNLYDSPLFINAA